MDSVVIDHQHKVVIVRFIGVILLLNLVRCHSLGRTTKLIPSSSGGGGGTSGIK